MIQLLKFNSLKQLINTLSNDKKCHLFLGQHRWNTGIVDCVKCGCEKVYVFSDGIRYKCKSCKKVFTAISNTFMHGTKLPLQDWLIAMWLMTHKKSASSVQMAKDLSVTQKTAWLMMQKIRTAMFMADESKLTGVVEIDEAFVGGKDRFKHKSKKIKHTLGRNWKDKTPVLGMLQRGGKLRAMVLDSVSKRQLKMAVYTNIQGGTTIMGDGFQGYKSLKAYDVNCVDHSRGWYVDGENHTNTIEGFWSQFKKTLTATYHHVSKKHLNNYLQESVFRYNNRNLTQQQQIERILWNMKKAA